MVRPAAPFVVPLDRATDLAEVGGKAWSLARIAQAKLPVPRGFVIRRDAFEALLDDGGGALRAFADATLSELDVGDTAALDAASSSIRARVLAATLPEALAAELGALATTFGAGVKLAVRSSGIGEDSREASFAGQLDTVLDVTPGEDLAKAVLACFASAFNARAIFYQRKRGVALGGVAVVVQEMVRAKIAGVLFTRAPARPDALLVEWVHGLGDKLVSGEVDPGRVAIERGSRRVHVEAEPETPDATLDELATSAEILEPLVGGALRLEEALEAPLDIEWAVGEEGVVFLQARPITVDAAVAAPDAPRLRFSNANVNENFPDPISPLLYSVARTGYEHYFRNVGRALGISEERLARVEHPLRHIIGVHGGRMYYNLSSIYEVLRVAPFGEQLAAYFDQFVGVHEAGSSTDADAPRESSSTALLELAAVAVQTTRQYGDLEARITTFEKAVDDFAARTRPELLETRPRHALLADLRAFLHIRCHVWRNASLADTGAMVTHGLLARVLRAVFPSEDASALHVTLLKGLPDIVSSKPVDALWGLSRLVREDAALAARFRSGEDARTLAQAIDALPAENPVRVAWGRYLEDWGFRGSGELMLTLPSFQEDPTALVDVLRPYVTMDGASPTRKIAEQAASRERETERILKSLRRKPLVRGMPGPILAVAVEKLLRATHATIGYRERARLKQALLYSRLRRLALAIGARLVDDRRLDAREDVFFLTHQELDELLAGSAMFPHGVKELVALRKKEHAALAETTPPDVVVLPQGDYLRLDADMGTPLADASTSNVLQGVATCGGHVTAPAAVMRDLGDMHRLREGDVLVTRQTDPGWAPVFFLIRGLVMERGGMLSHGAIIAREFGIPAVVGIRDATTRIPTGATLVVDGDRGRVELRI